MLDTWRFNQKEKVNCEVILGIDLPVRVHELPIFVVYISNISGGLVPVVQTGLARPSAGLREGYCVYDSPASICPSDREIRVQGKQGRGMGCRQPLWHHRLSGRPFNSSVPIVSDQPNCVHAAMQPMPWPMAHGPMRLTIPSAALGLG